MTGKDFAARTAVCSVDGPVALLRRGNAWQCGVAYSETKRRINRDRSGTPYGLKSNTCACCGFVGDLVQMDLDHIDGNRANHALENIQTLCANCHRLKSFRPLLYVPRSGADRHVDADHVLAGGDQVGPAGGQ